MPVNADFQGGNAHDPGRRAANVRRGAETGVAGLSIEDFAGDEAEPLYEFDLAVERVAAARLAIDESGTGVVLTGRSEGPSMGGPTSTNDLAAACVRRCGRRLPLRAALSDLAHVAAIVAAVAPKPVNLLINAPFTPVAEAAALGVRRVSVGGTLARVAWGGFLQAAREIADDGTFTRFQDLPDVEGLLGHELNRRLAKGIWVPCADDQAYLEFQVRACSRPTWRNCDASRSCRPAGAGGSLPRLLRACLRRRPPRPGSPR